MSKKHINKKREDGNFNLAGCTRFFYKQPFLEYLSVFSPNAGKCGPE